jgi:Leucine-rich repeat (LRR) protein
MTNTINGYFKVSGDNTRALEFGPRGEFNGTNCSSVFRAELRRQLRDSFEVVIEQYGEKHETISELKISNQSVLTWDDHWIDRSRGVIVDPRINRLILKRNELVYVNINTPRPELKFLDLEGNKTLQVLHLHECPSLEVLDISGCAMLSNVSLGINRSLRRVSANGCNMSPSAMEQLLRDFTPVVTASANVKGAGVFRKPSETLLDLRGNTVDWSNKRISSKIRLLLTNNWIVKWDNTPPVDVIPPQFYAVFVESAIGSK